MTIKEDVKDIEYLKTGFNVNMNYNKLFARLFSYLIKNHLEVRKRLKIIEDKLGTHVY